MKSEHRAGSPPRAAARSLSAIVVAVAIAASLGASPAFSSYEAATGDLSLNVEMETKYQFGDFCTAALPEGVQCVRFEGNGLVPGLGRVAVTYTKTVELAKADCPVTQPGTVVMTVPSGDRIELTMPGSACGPTAPARVGPLSYGVTGGTGRFADASGTLHLSSHVRMVDWACGCGNGTDTWTGTLSVPGAEFDVAAPALNGPRSLTLRVAKGKKKAVGRFTVTATDSRDGPVTVACTPRSGTAFRLGRTTVRCAATDTSGNTGRWQFVVIVKKGG